MCDYAGACNLSWRPTLRAMRSPTGQQVMVPAPGQPGRYDGIGAVNSHPGEAVVLLERRKRRREVARLLAAPAAERPTGAIYVAGDNADTHADDEVEDVVRAAAGRPVLLYLPPYRPWLNPIEMLWRHSRREVTHGERSERMPALLAAAREGLARFDQCPRQILPVIGAKAAKAA